MSVLNCTPPKRFVYIIKGRFGYTRTYFIELMLKMYESIELVSVLKKSVSLTQQMAISYVAEGLHLLSLWPI